MKILVADSQELLRKGLVALLRSVFDDVQVTEAADGLELVKLAKTQLLDVVILDPELSQLDGLKAAGQLLAGGLSLPVIFLSRWADTHSVQQAMGVGASGYVLKEDSADQLRDAVLAVLRGEVYLSPSLRDQIALDRLEHSAGDDKGFASLSARQVEILTCIAAGMSIREISSQTGLATKTLDAHRRRIQQRLGVDSTAGLTRIAIREGLVDLDGSPIACPPA